MMNNAAVLKSPSAPASEEVPLLTILDGFEECEAILARNNVGRIGFALQDRVSIVPVHYVYERGWIYGRTASGGKLRDILRNRRVVFEVDEHSQLFEWRSVVVRGPLYLIEPGTTAANASVHAKAVGLIRRLVTSALSGSDPVPFRDQLFRIRVVEISGRASEPTGGKRVCPLSQQPTVRNGEPESDAVVRQQVETALETLSLAPTSRIQLDVFDGVVVLTGSTQDSAERSEIEAAVLEVPEVEAVVQQLETAFPPQPQPAPAEIARDALTLLRQSPAVSDPGIKIIAEHGWLRLEGVANSRRSRDEVVRRLRGVKGSRGVIDKLRVMGPAAARVVAE